MTSSMNGSVLTPLRRENSSCISDLKATSKCLRLHLNSLWSIWYGICIAAFNGYIVLECAKRYFDYEDLRLASSEKVSNNELNVCIALTGVSVLFLPFFLSSAIFKVGNLANDGFKLGRNLNACSADPPAGVTIFAKNGCQRLWQHCGPAASLFHLIMAFCVLIPKLIMEARLIQMNVLSKDSIWKTDLDFIIPHHDRSLTTFNFTSPTQSSTILTVNNSNLETTTTNTTVATPSSVTAIHAVHPKNAAFIAAASYEILFEDNVNISSVSIEYLNYAVALLIYSIRYPSVFWGTNKYFGILFSVQLLINGVQCLLLHTGISILYKIHVMGTREQLPYLFVLANKFFLHFGKPFILNKEVTLTLYVMSTVLVLISSLVLYLYGYGRLNSFLHREQARRIISMRDLQSGRSWGYFTHCVALCVLVAIAVCEAPLLYDLSVVYRGSLDSLVLVVILSSILHLFVWVLLWLILTLKQHWEFKLRVTVGQAAVRSARSIKLVTDVHLVSSMADHANAPLLVVGHGKTYTVSDGQAKRSIMAVIQKANMDKKIKAGHINNTKSVTDDIDEQIYWLRPKSRTPRCSPDSSSSDNRFGWFTKRRVTVNRNGLEEITALTGKYTSKKYIGGTNDDDGDYVRLREIPMADMNASTSRIEHSSDDTTSEDNKLLESVRNDTVTYASVNKEHLNPSIREFDDPSPLLTPEPEDHDDLPPPPPELSVGFVSPTKTEHHQDLGKCLQRTDSGMPTEELPSRSDSEVSGGSPPDKTCSNSETSSGVHSNSSRESCNRNNFDHHQLQQQPVNIFNESMQKIAPQQWMQRNSVIQSSGTGSPGALSSSASPIYGTASAIGPSATAAAGFNRVYKPQQHYAAVANKTPSISEVGEDSTTVVIMRKPNNNHLYHQTKPVAEDAIGRFDRSTNMHLSSFTDRHPTSDAVKTAASATLPHYPTQPPMGGATPYSHCSTMPILNSGNPNCAVIGNGGSCGSFPRPHTTIPVHHNGVRFSHHHMMINGVAGNSPYAASKRILPVSTQQHNYPLSGNATAIVYKPPSHHTFPQLPMHHQQQQLPPPPPPGTKYYHLQANNTGSERDSANFSMASSGADSDGCHSNNTSSATVASS